MSLSQPRCWVSVQNCLDFHEISFFRKIWLKIQSPQFSKRFLSFFLDFEWMIIKIPNLNKTWGFVSRINSWSWRDSWNLEPLVRKTQICKVLRFGPNFRWVFFMSIMEIIWDYFTQIHHKYLFIHDLSWFQASPKVLSQVDSGSSQFCKTFANFLYFDPKYHNIHRKSIHGF